MPDPRRVTGSVVHVKARIVTNLAQCARYYGSLAKTKLFNGIELRVLTDTVKNRASTSIEAEWTLIDVPSTIKIIKSVNFINFKAG